MNFPTLAVIAASMALAASAARAHTDAHHAPAKPQAHGHAQGHGHAPALLDTPFGRQGDPAKVARTITIDMTDNMRFTPAVLQVERGQTVRLNVVNKGQLLHELVLGTAHGHEQHRLQMQHNPGMAHVEPQMVHVRPGEKGEVVWQFTEAGEFQFACLLPGHFEAGMVGKVVV